MRKVAVIADVHGNAPAFRAVLDEIERENVDLIVSCGDLTWGPLPEETYELARSLNARFVRGNADRAVLERRSETDRERWMQEHHDNELRDFLATFEGTVAIEVEGLGPVRLAHGSPRSDEECVTPETPEERVREFSAGVDERVIVTAHVHIQFDREVAGVRSVNAGSVGLPYEGCQGAFWALLGPDVEHRRTPYEVDVAAAMILDSGMTNADEFAGIITAPPRREETARTFEERGVS